MKKPKNLIAVCLLMTMVSCSSISTSTSRDPSSVGGSKKWEELRDLKQRRVELSALSVHFQKKKNINQLKKIQREQKKIDERINEIESNITAYESGLNPIQNDSVDWHGEKEKSNLAVFDKVR